MCGENMLLQPARGGLKSMLGTPQYVHYELDSHLLTSHLSPHSVFLGKIKEAFDRDGELQNLLMDSFFSQAVQDCQV